MEMGAAAVLVNTSVATAGDPALIAEAYALAIRAGRLAFLSKLRAPQERPRPPPSDRFFCMNSEAISISEIKNLLADDTRAGLEDLARQASLLTRQYFGRTISLYTPLYLSNYCSSSCTYCGFSKSNRITRMKLTVEQMREEMKRIAATGIENILLLTGESYKATPLSYLLDAVTAAKSYFPNISLEVHPMETAQYRELFSTASTE